jgi:hypothetical protein
VLLAEGMLFTEVADVAVSWLWRNGKIDWFGTLVVKKANDKMVSIAGDEGSIAWCV